MRQRVGIATVQVPFVRGGAEALAESLRTALVDRGFDAEIISAPFKWYPPHRIVEAMAFWRSADLSEFGAQAIDRLIGLKFPAYLTPHPAKVLWLVHQHRTAYELWGSEWGDLEHQVDGLRVREIIRRADSRMIPEAKRVYTISATVSDRLRGFNGVDSRPLYPPSPLAGRLSFDGLGDFVFYPSRLVNIKRQALLIEALRFTKTPVRAVIAGTGPDEAVLRALSHRLRLDRRVEFPGFQPVEDLVAHYAGCLAVFFSPYQEDLGLVALEAMEAQKPLITCEDSGEPARLVSTGGGGLVVPHDDPHAMAEALDRLYLDRGLCRSYGRAGAGHLDSLHISWDTVVEALTS